MNVVRALIVCRDVWRRFGQVALVTALAALTTLAACDRPPPAPVTLRVGVFNTLGLLPHYVMQEQGFDKKYGLRFEETAYPGGAAVIDAMVSGVLDVGPVVGTVPLFVAAEAGLIPDKIVAVAATNFADSEHPGAGVIVAPTVKRWKDLAGKKIGVNARNSVISAAVDIRLKQEGVGGYSFVEIPLSNLGLAVAGGNVAAASIIEPHLTQSLLRGDGKLLDWVVGGPPFERMQYESIVFSTEFLRRNPEGVKAYLRAHLAAVRWINDHPDQARLLLVRRMNISADLAKKIHLRRWPGDARTDPALLDQTQQVLLRAGLIKQPLDTRALHDETLLAEVLKERQ